MTLTANITVSVTDSDTASVNVGVTGSVSVIVSDNDTVSVPYPHYNIINQALDNLSTFFFGSALALSKARRTLSS